MAGVAGVAVETAPVQVHIPFVAVEEERGGFRKLSIPARAAAAVERR